MSIRHPGCSDIAVPSDPPPAVSTSFEENSLCITNHCALGFAEIAPPPPRLAGKPSLASTLLATNVLYVTHPELRKRVDGDRPTFWCGRLARLADGYVVAEEAPLGACLAVGEYVQRRARARGLVCDDDVLETQVPMHLEASVKPERLRRGRGGAH